jgi:hypothetical protein
VKIAGTPQFPGLSPLAREGEYNPVKFLKLYQSAKGVKMRKTIAAIALTLALGAGVPAKLIGLARSCSDESELSVHFTGP